MCSSWQDFSKTSIIRFVSCKCRKHTQNQWKSRSLSYGAKLFLRTQLHHECRAPPGTRPCTQVFSLVLAPVKSKPNTSAHYYPFPNCLTSRVWLQFKGIAPKLMCQLCFLQPNSCLLTGKKTPCQPNKQLTKRRLRYSSHFCGSFSSSEEQRQARTSVRPCLEIAP